MGTVCTCLRAEDKGHQFRNPIHVKNTSSFISLHPFADPEATKQELNRYVEANRELMNKQIRNLFTLAIEAPADGLSGFRLKFCNMKADDWSHFSTLLFYGQHAMRLNLWKLKLGTRGFESICGYLDMLKNLRILVLCDLALGHYNFDRMIPAIKKMTQLETLNLSVNEINTRQVTLLANIFSNLSHLKKIILDENDVEDEGCVALCHKMHTLRHLELLSLKFNSVTPAGYLVFSDLLRIKDGLRIVADGLKVPDHREMDRSRSFATSEDPVE